MAQKHHRIARCLLLHNRETLIETHYLQSCHLTIPAPRSPTKEGGWRPNKLPPNLFFTIILHLLESWRKHAKTFPRVKWSFFPNSLTWIQCKCQGGGSKWPSLIPLRVKSDKPCTWVNKVPFQLLTASARVNTSKNVLTSGKPSKAPTETSLLPFPRQRTKWLWKRHLYGMWKPLSLSTTLACIIIKLSFHFLFDRKKWLWQKTWKS